MEREIRSVPLGAERYRRDLPAGQYSVSTAHWFDAVRTSIRGQTLHFYTPGKSHPIEFDLQTGETSPADAVVAGQGDDKENWRKRWLERRSNREAGRNGTLPGTVSRLVGSYDRLPGSAGLD
jgi:hypothetical protein